MQRIAILLAVGLQLSAFGAGVDAQTSDLLIKKFERVYLQLPPGDDSRVPVTLRLADLLAEKARRLAMDEMNNGCTECVAGAQERKDALKYYLEVVEKLADDKRSRVLSQMGHLYEMNGETEKALKLYSDVIVAEKNPALLGEVHLSMAELQFRRANYPLAQKHYEAALGFAEFERRGFAAYRLAWTQFNLGNLKDSIAGLIKILHSPELLTRSGASAGGAVSVDKQFQEEVSRDLATFVARRGMTMDDVVMIYEQSPEAAKLANVIYLASELERLGQTGQAVKVWRFLQDKQGDPLKRLEGHIRLAQLELNQQHRPESVKEYGSALRLWTQVGNCTQNECKEMLSRLKNYIVDWNREEKRHPSAELFETYEQYLATFPQELDMTVWAAQVAQERQEWLKAYALLGTAATLRTSASEAAAKDMPTHEALLLSQVEVAEKSKSEEMIGRSLDEYLAKTKEKSKWVDVHYQRAHRLYKANKYAEAAEALKIVALLPENQAVEVKKQAADLALDALVLLKRDQDIEAWAQQFAAAFKGQSNDYQNIAHRSVLNQVASLANEKATTQDLQKAWETLNRMDVAHAADAEKITYFKNRLILAEKLKNLDEVSSSIDKLTAIKSVTPEDKQFALSRKAWLAEMQLDFKTALVTSEKLQMPEIQPDQRALKLAMYADLAGAGADNYYRQFLKTGTDKEKRQAVAAKLVRESAKPQKALDDLASILKENPELYASLQYEIYLKDGNRQVALSRLSGKQFANTLSLKVLWKEDYLARYVKAKAEITGHAMKAETEKVLGRSLEQRMKMLSGLERLLKEAVEHEDWSTQMLTVQLLGAESNRFYQELLSLPMPEGLSPEQQNEYLQALSQQAGPHQIRAQELQTKTQEFWAHENLVGDFAKKMPVFAGAERDKYVMELSLVAAAAPEALKPQLEQILQTPAQQKLVPTIAELEGARQQVRSQPFNRGSLENLLTLEKKMGREAMVVYLENRLAKLDEPGSASPQAEGK